MGVVLMRIRDIEIVLAVATLCSFTKAAERLGLTQPAISQAVKRVEFEFGASIFLRTNHHLEMTVTGLSALKTLSRIQDLYNFGFKGNLPRTSVKVGLSTLLCGVNLAPFISSLHAIGIEQIEIEVGPSKQLFGRGDLDVSVISSDVVDGDYRGIGMQSCWIGSETGVQIRYKTEYDVWNSGGSSLSNYVLSGHKLIEVNDFGHAYQLAISGVGVTPCAAVDPSALARTVPDLWPLPSVRFQIVTENTALADVVEMAFSVCLKELKVPTRDLVPPANLFQRNIRKSPSTPPAEEPGRRSLALRAL